MGCRVLMTIHYLGIVTPPPPVTETLKRFGRFALRLLGTWWPRASAVEVSLHGTVDGVEVVVADNGDGFDPEERASFPGGGIGLTSMRERSELLEGVLTVESSVGNGCRVRLRIPTRS